MRSLVVVLLIVVGAVVALVTQLVGPVPVFNGATLVGAILLVAGIVLWAKGEWAR